MTSRESPKPLGPDIGEAHALAYVTLAVCAYAARTHLRESLFGVGAAPLPLLFVGIHNAWDAVTYHVFLRK